MRDGVEIIHQGRDALIILSGDAENNRVIGLEGSGGRAVCVSLSQRCNFEKSHDLGFRERF